MTSEPQDNPEIRSASADLSPLLIALLKGVIYRDESTGTKARQWRDLLGLQHRVRDYVSVLGLTLELDEAEGYAYLRSVDREAQDPDSQVPRLVARRPLSFPISLLLALLRKKLAEFDAGGQEGGVRLVLSREEIVELVRVFLPETSNEVRLMDRVDTDIKKVVELGFLRRMKSTTGQPAGVRGAAHPESPSSMRSGWPSSMRGSRPTGRSSLARYRVRAMPEPQDLGLDFVADDALTGFRLGRLEVFNWGTFDERVWTLARRRQERAADRRYRLGKIDPGGRGDHACWCRRSAWPTTRPPVPTAVSAA